MTIETTTRLTDAAIFRSKETAERLARMGNKAEGVFAYDFEAVEVAGGWAIRCSRCEMYAT